MADPPELLTERRAQPSIAEELGLVAANQATIAANLESLRDEVNERFQDHSERINAYVAEARTAQRLLVGNMKRESELRQALAKESSARHDLLMTALNQVIATQASGQLAFMDMSAALGSLREQHHQDYRESSNALKQHAKRESALTRAGVMIPGLVALASGTLAWLFHPTINRAIEAVNKLFGSPP